MRSATGSRGLSPFRGQSLPRSGDSPLGPPERTAPAPMPITRLFAKPCANRVLENVETARLESNLVFDHVDRVPSPEEVSVPVMTLVEQLRVAPVQDLQAAGELRPLGLDDQVVMSRHQAEGVALPFVGSDHAAQDCHEALSIDVVEVDVAVVRPSACNVVGTDLWQIAARSSRHCSKLGDIPPIR